MTRLRTDRLAASNLNKRPVAQPLSARVICNYVCGRQRVFSLMFARIFNGL